MAGSWRQSFTDGALAAVSRTLMLRDRALGVTHKLRRHPLAQDIYFTSGDRTLAAVYVPGEPGVPVLLLCHGIGETVEHWSAAQALLRDRGVGSLVFNYSGYARSTGKLCAQHCNEDFLAAYAELRRRVGAEMPVFVLGFSLGSGIAAKGIGMLRPQAAGLFLCEAFTSFADAACSTRLPRALVAWLVPRIWETESILPHVTVPVCVVHSDGDKLFPVRMAERNAAAAGERGSLIVVKGLEHNEPFLKAVDRYWQPILQRVMQNSVSAACPYVHAEDHGRSDRFRSSADDGTAASANR
jgi:alpha-beta hydrolase superfamily lysophospholipase